jgi:hypothetical protein
MSSRLARLVVVGVMAVGPALLPACCTSNTAAGSVAEFNPVTGRLSTTFSAPLDRAYAAAEGAVNDLQFTTLDKPKDALKGIVNAQMADGNKIAITLEKKGDALTECTVDVGALGKEATARLIMDKIEARVK